MSDGYPDTVLVVGSGACVWDDLARVPAWATDEIIAVNDIGVHLPLIHHWVTLHPEKMSAWVEMRRVHRRHAFGKFTTWTNRWPHQHFNDMTQRQHPHAWGGSSALLAVRVALFERRARRVVLAGVPMDASPKFDSGTEWPHWHIFRKDWTRHAHSMQRVRSMSGWTRDLLGAPSWLTESSETGAT